MTSTGSGGGGTPGIGVSCSLRTGDAGDGDRNNGPVELFTAW